MSQQQSYGIFGSGDGQLRLTDEQLIAYLAGRLSPEETRRVETILAEAGMESDAAEGLMELPAAEAQEMVTHLNHKMRQQLKSRKTRRRPANDWWAWVAVLLVLLLIAVAYYLVQLLGAK